MQNDKRILKIYQQLLDSTECHDVLSVDSDERTSLIKAMSLALVPNRISTFQMEIGRNDLINLFNLYDRLLNGNGINIHIRNDESTEIQSSNNDFDHNDQISAIGISPDTSHEFDHSTMISNSSSGKDRTSTNDEVNKTSV